ncbi:MAG TPA: sulfotransferase domain-containing protein [Vicinamibacterales bacterium]|nr:sulfotransferase domain-containing protein [Vicinamibacterales bacterium]
MSDTLAYPVKTREIKNAIVDSTRWNYVTFRDGDIVVATYAKTGTTWTQQIVCQLVHQGKDRGLFEASPWVDMRPVPLEIILEGLAAQKHRRFMKTHLPLDALVFSPKAKYLYVARDGRDVAWSMFNHHAGFTEQMYPMMNNIFGREGEPLAPPTGDVRQYFLEWLDGGGLPMGVSYWEHLQGWFDSRHLPNVLLLHFNDLKADLPGEMRRIAAFLDIAIDEAKMPQMLEHCSLEYMRAHASEHSPIIDMIFQRGGATFFNQGTNGRWKDVLTAADLEKYDRLVRENLTPDCARWMATGELPV